MGDPMDSQIDSRKAATIPRSAGRGLTPDKLHYLAALPRVDGVEDADDLADGVAGLVAAIAENWTGPTAPRVRMLPAKLPSRSCRGGGRERPADRDRLDENELAPVWHDFAENPHLIVVATRRAQDEPAEAGRARHHRAVHAGRGAIMTVDIPAGAGGERSRGVPLGTPCPWTCCGTWWTGGAGGQAAGSGEDIAPSRMRLCDWWQGRGCSSWSTTTTWWAAGR
ncbi:hypothetical protein GCM10023238_14410 [Streptomyces heliomycini]